MESVLSDLKLRYLVYPLCFLLIVGLGALSQGNGNATEKGLESSPSGTAMDKKISFSRQSLDTGAGRRNLVKVKADLFLEQL